MPRTYSTKVPVLPGPGFLVVDTETTGLARYDRVIEIALVHLSPCGSIESTFATVLKGDGSPGCRAAREKHGISEKQLRRAPAFEAIVDGLFHALNSERIIVAHNESFDRRMINQELSRIGWPTMRKRLLCTMGLASALGYGGKLSLAKAVNLLSIPHHPTHAACEDAVATAHLLAQLQRRHPQDFARHVTSIGYSL